MDKRTHTFRITYKNGIGWTVYSDSEAMLIAELTKKGIIDLIASIVFIK